jgi:hypothetical protein
MVKEAYIETRTWTEANGCFSFYGSKKRMDR